MRFPPNLAEPACFLPLEHISILVLLLCNTLWGTPKDVSGSQCSYITVFILNGLIAPGGVLQTKSLPCGDLQHMTQGI